MTDEQRAAYRSLRAAAHRLLCDTQELRGRVGRVAVRAGKLDALDRALRRADEIEDKEAGIVREVPDEQAVR